MKHFIVFQVNATGIMTEMFAKSRMEKFTGVLVLSDATPS
jgi:hypothetical protein